MGVSSTSIENHDFNVSNGLYTPMQKQIVAAIVLEGPMTRRQLVKYTGIEVNSISGRCNELVEQGTLEVSYKGKCPVTGRTAEFLCLHGKSIPVTGNELSWEMKTEGKDTFIQSGDFRIYNRGRKGGNEYCLYRLEPRSKTFSHLKGMGRLEAMKLRAGEL